MTNDSSNGRGQTGPSTDDIDHLDNETFELVRHIAGKALVEEERVDLEGDDPRAVEIALWSVANVVTDGVYISAPEERSVDTDSTNRQKLREDARYIIGRLENELENKQELNVDAESIEYTRGKLAGAKIVKNDLLTNSSLRKNHSVDTDDDKS